MISLEAPFLKISGSKIEDARGSGIIAARKGLRAIKCLKGIQTAHVRTNACNPGSGAIRMALWVSKVLRAGQASKHTCAPVSLV